LLQSSIFEVTILNNKLNILFTNLFNEFNSLLKECPLSKLEKINKQELPVDYFKFYKSVSSVYSSKIEGENIDFDSYYKYKFLNVSFKPNYTKKADDLYNAYEFIEKTKLNLNNVKQAHTILSANLLPKNKQGFIRTNPMFVINSEDLIDYVATNPKNVKSELSKLFKDIKILQDQKLTTVEVFYFASLIHLIFVKIHPFLDGNGRTARLIEKWFLIEKLGKKATSIPLEKNYFKYRNAYYNNLKKLGLEYEVLDYTKSLDFLLMTVKSL